MQETQHTQQTILSPNSTKQRHRNRIDVNKAYKNKELWIEDHARDTTYTMDNTSKCNNIHNEQPKMHLVQRESQEGEHRH